MSYDEENGGIVAYPMMRETADGQVNAHPEFTAMKPA